MSVDKVTTNEMAAIQQQQQQQQQNSSTTTTTSHIMSVSEFYNNKTVFITGGTGFMGKVLLEKLLRSCPGIIKIYLLIRTKKGQDAHERLKQLLCSPLFDTIRKLRPNDLNKVLPIEGDITQPELLINQQDRLLLQNNVNIVFHSAATVKFDEKLKLSVTINLLGTQRLVELCSRMTNLEALVHVSTAYCNCDRNEVKEEIYQPPILPDQIASIVDCLDEQLLDTITNKLINNRPNTYTFTKSLTEYWLNDYKQQQQQNNNNNKNLPIVIVRPSIVLSSMYGPLNGWVDNWNGPTGIIAAAGKGIFHTMLCDGKKIADLIPVDMVINLMLVSAWRIGTSKTKDLTIYNCCTGVHRPITWKDFIDLSFKYMKKHPFSEITWYPTGTVTANRLLNKFNQIWMHWLPAYVLDTLVWFTGGKPIMVRIHDKLEKAALCLEYFATKEWYFDDTNVQQLYKLLTDNDRQEFCFDVTEINWNKYIEDYILGIRQYIFKENFKTIPKARKQITKYYLLHKCIQLFSIIGMWYFLTLRYTPLKQLWCYGLRLLTYLARMLPFI